MSSPPPAVDRHTEPAEPSLRDLQVFNGDWEDDEDEEDDDDMDFDPEGAADSEEIEYFGIDDDEDDDENAYDEEAGADEEEGGEDDFHGAFSNNVPPQNRIAKYLMMVVLHRCDRRQRWWVGNRSLYQSPRRAQWRRYHWLHPRDARRRWSWRRYDRHPRTRYEIPRSETFDQSDWRSSLARSDPAVAGARGLEEDIGTA